MGGSGGLSGSSSSNNIHLDTNIINSLPPDSNNNAGLGVGSGSGSGSGGISGLDKTATGNEVLIMNANSDDRTASFFAQPGILAGEWRRSLVLD